MLIGAIAQAVLYSTLSLLLFAALSLYGSLVPGLGGRFHTTRFFAGLTLLAATRWFLFIGGVTFYPNLIALGVNAAVFAVLSFRNRPAAPVPEGHGPEVEACLAYFAASAIFLTCYLSKIPDGHLPLYTLGNNDLFYFLSVSNFLADPVNAALGHPIDFLKEIRGDVFGVFALVAFLSKFTANNTQAVPVLLGTVSGLLAASALQLMRRAGVGTAVRLAACCIPAASPMLYYVSGHFFIGQMLSWSVLLAALDAQLESGDRKGLASATILYAFIWLFYPSYAIPMTLVLGAALLFQTICEAAGGESLKSAAVRFARRAAVCLAVPAVLSLAATFPRVVSVLQMVESQATGSQGWPLALLTFPTLTGLPSGQLASALASAIVPYAAAILAMIGAALYLRARERNRAITALAATYAFALAVCLVYSLLHENSYRQWKLATFIAFPLWFIPLIVIHRFLGGLAGERVTAGVLTAACAALLCINIYSTYEASPRYTNTFAKPITFSSGFALLSEINDDASVRQVNLTMDSHASAMLACDFLYKKKLALFSDSYFAKTAIGYPSSPGTLFIQPLMCANKKADDYTVGGHFLVSAAGFSSGNELTLGATYTLTTQARQTACIVFSGFAMNEFGAWADPGEASMRFHAPGDESSHTLVLTGFGFTNRLTAPILVDVSVNGVLTATWELGNIDTESALRIAVDSGKAVKPEITVTFKARNAHTPSELEIGDSSQRYGLILRSVTLE